jgi:hypothetical protein
MSELMDLVHSVEAIVLGGDYVGLAIMVVIAFAVGWMIPNLGGLISGTVGALVLFALATLARNAVASHGKDVGGLAESGWNHLMHVAVHDMLVYAIAFAILITVVNIIRSVVMR